MEDILGLEAGGCEHYGTQIQEVTFLHIALSLLLRTVETTVHEGLHNDCALICKTQGEYGHA